MLQLQKGISLFIVTDDVGHQEIGMGLLRFLSDDFNYLTLNFNPDITFGSPSYSKSINVTETNYKEAIKDNSFRLDGLFIYLKRKLVDVSGFWQYLKSLELQIFVVIDYKFMDNYFRDNRVIARQIFQLNPNLNRRVLIPSGTNLQVISSVSISKDSKYIFTDLATDEKFTLYDFETSYIRDKKLGILLDKNNDI